VLRERAPVGAVKERVDPAHRGACALRQLAAEVGELHAARAAVEQRLAQLLLQLAHGARDDLGRDRQAHRGVAEVGGVGGGAEDAQGFEAVGHEVGAVRYRLRAGCS
jgi:hypothetical protein